MEPTVKERLVAYLQEKGLGQNRFEKMAGLSNAYISNLKANPSPKILTKILNAAPELNRDWLLYGEGEMFNDDNKDVDVALPAPPANLIPFYDAETTGGFDGLVSTSTAEATLQGYISAGGWFAGRETAAIRHVGDSMTEYPDGSILAVREVLDKRLLVFGRNYVVETDEYRITKRIQRGPTPHTITLYSSNEDHYADGRLIHEPFDLLLTDIRRIFAILGFIVNQSGEMTLLPAPATSPTR